MDSMDFLEEDYEDPTEEDNVILPRKDYEDLQRKVKEKDLMIGRLSNDLGSVRGIAENLAELPDYGIDLFYEHQGQEYTERHEGENSMPENQQYFSREDLEKMIDERAEAKAAERIKAWENESTALIHTAEKAKSRILETEPDLVNSQYGPVLQSEFNRELQNRRANGTLKLEDIDVVADAIVEAVKSNIENGIYAKPVPRYASSMTNTPRQAIRPPVVTSGNSSDATRVVSSDGEIPQVGLQDDDAMQKAIADSINRRRQASRESRSSSAFMLGRQ